MIQIASAGWGLWTLLIVFFAVGPAVRWGVRGGRRGYWGLNDWDDGPVRRNRDLRAALEERDAVIESLDARVAELENRLDFAERLLADGRRAGLTEGTRTPVGSLDERSTT